MSIGAWLRSEPLSAYQAKGAHGEPAFRSALQLRRAVQVRLGPDAAEFLAIPKINEQGDTIDWYAPSGGDVVPPENQTPEERVQARAQAQEIQGRLRAGAQALQGAAQGRDDKLFAALLGAAAEFPDAGHVYLVNGKPVATFWGFTHIGRDETSWAAVAPPPVVPAPVLPVAAPVPVVAPVAGRGCLPWLLPLLLLLLLLPQLFFGLRSCAPEVVDPLIARVAPFAIEQPVVPVVPGTDSGTSVPVQPVGQGTETPGTQTPGTQTPGTETRPPEPPPEPPPVRPGPPPEPPQVHAEPPPEADKSLVIPPDARKDGKADFLEGNWTNRTGLFAERDGKPVVVEYSFDKEGNGTSTIRQQNGVECHGPTKARMQGGKLVIEELDHPTCSDGYRFYKSTVDCSMGNDGRAACRGRHSSGKTYDVDIQRSQAGKGP